MGNLVSKIKKKFFFETTVFYIFYEIIKNNVELIIKKSYRLIVTCNSVT